ncbi:MAG: EAL domain-containing protein [Candidatus Thiodiazotropha sp.]
MAPGETYHQYLEVNLSSRSITVFALTASLLLAGLFARLLFLEFERESTLTQARLAASYHSLLAGYREFADVTSQWLLSDEQTLVLMQRILDGDNVARGLLYRTWTPFYRSLRLKHVRQLHFMDAAGISQLRMHAPHRSGDNLRSSRPLIKSVIVTGKPASGFENGAIFSGFRFVYPIKDRGRLLGVLEIGLSFAAIRRQLENDAETGTVVRFLLSRADLLRTTRSPDESSVSALLDSLYMPALGNRYFVTENLANPLFGTPEHVLPGYAQAVELRIGQNIEVQRQMRDDGGGAHLICTDWLDCFQVGLLPVKTRAGETVAYILSYAPVPHFAERAWRQFLLLVAGIAAITLLALLLVQVKRTRRHMQMIGEHVGKGIYVINPSGVITYINPAASRILGYRPEELLQQHAHELFHAESENVQNLPSADCPIRKVTEIGQVYRSNNEVFLSKEGTRIPVEVTASPIIEYGEVSSVVTVFDDIRERLAAEARMSESSAAFDQTAEGLMITDEKHRITQINRAFTEVTGYTQYDVLGKTPAVLASGKHPASFYQKIYNDLESNGVWQGEIFNKRKNGEIYPEWLSISVVRNARGNVASYVAVFRDISDIKEKENRLAYLAQHDALTGLPNRNLLKDRLLHAMERCRRQGVQLGVLFMDLDRFKKVNDSLGHDIGDEMLCEAVKRFRNNLRVDDTLARIGGDEFVVLLEDWDDINYSHVVVDKLLQTISNPFELGGHEVFVGLSIGVSVYPDDGEDCETLLRNSDTAMYHAKHAGGNTWRRHNAVMEADPVERIRLETELRHALENGELCLYYQPKLNLHTQQFNSVEALVRWNHPTRGMLTPGDFLMIAENGRMMHEIGIQVLRMAVSQLAEWCDRNIDIGICINVDGDSIGRHDFVERVTGALNEFDVDPNRFGIEITENAIADQTVRVVNELSRLDEMGITLSIDDFGTGHSSLTRLKNLPFRILKVDASFIRGMLEEHSDKVIVGATIALAHELHLQVVAEGVETDGQLAELRSMGCDAIQGYLFARPMPPEQVEQLLLD